MHRASTACQNKYGMVRGLHTYWSNIVGTRRFVVWAWCGGEPSNACKEVRIRALVKVTQGVWTSYIPEPSLRLQLAL